jgi:hypothetical protein
MKKGLLTVLVIGAVVVIAVLLSGQLGQRGPVVTQESSQILPQATGNIEDAVNALLKDIEIDEAFASEEYLDADLVGADAAAVSDFGQIADPNAF